MVTYNDFLIYYYRKGGDSLTSGAVASVTKTNLMDYLYRSI
ncbi:MAG: hypothetical protein SGJ04_04070 [Bacteroidota bacterium]|nr:hypothetical protein [Bacteroidota bacterium]